jgi:hypothetical protein
MSTSITETTVSPPVKPTDDAAIITCCEPSTIRSAIAVITKLVAEAPAAIVTVADIETSVESEATSETVNAEVVGVLRDTVPIAVPPFSEMEEGEILRLSVGTSSSVTETDTLPVAIPLDAAESTID